MNHPRNTNYERLRAPRTLIEAFGPEAKLHVPKKRDAKGWLYAIGYGIAIGITWYLIVAMKAGA